MPMSQSNELIKSAQRTIRLELEAIEELLPRIDSNFTRACDLILASKGRVVVVGMGKSGHIGNKIAATLASTGTTAFFVHPAEASHGDMGMITRDDVVLALSNSGSTAEIVTLLPLIKRLGITLISMTGNPDSALAKAAEVNLDARVSQEACPLNLAPTSSTTASLVLGDALAIALLEARGFTAEDFAFSHPGGALGRRLLLKVENVMHGGASLPSVQRGTSLRDALLEMTQKGLGMTVVIEDDGRLAGVFTDGDLRRTLDRGIDVRQSRIDDVMTVHGKTARAEMLAAEALKIMEDHKISGLVVVDSDDRPVGALNMHDLLRAGVM
ncbi:KpsF/GutQ family sugar-phosphate isomerase [Pseudomonas sp. MMS21-TM103]|uniref:KpsF/GutQ family sugar-phosphate isomerase n=1 Tax=unclassified Pseudomonas TaxID=196821 RepID=UPI001EDE4E25|nr:MULTISPECIES: KpsF/GutQ family sugar-phosphate isomerase [unclassified Pseudomonas]MCG4451971.1 KpsF/GutQ family sugar-phosphate isomerase [Pseudomonas sp. MMS21 TM103]